MRIKPLLTLGFILLATTVQVIPSVDAVATLGAAPTIYTATGYTQTLSGVSTAQRGASLGILGTNAANDLNFALGTTATGWSVVNADITGALTVAPQRPALINFGPTHWAALFYASATALVWTSADDGATWAQSTTFGALITGSEGNTIRDMHSPADGKLHVIAGNSDFGATGELYYMQTTNYGTAWSTAIMLSDNTSNNGVSLCTYGVLGGVIWARETNPVVVVLITCPTAFNTPGKLWQIQSVDGGNFWSAPQTGSGTLISAGSREDGGTFLTASKDRTDEFYAIFRLCTGGCTGTYSDRTIHFKRVGTTNTITVSADLSILFIGATGPGGAIAVAYNSNSRGVIIGDPGDAKLFFSNNFGVVPSQVATISNTGSPIAGTMDTTHFYYTTVVSGCGGCIQVWQYPITEDAPPVPPDSVGSQAWCSNPQILDYNGDGADGPGNDDFGYNYAEDVTFIADPPIALGTTSMGDAYEFDSDSTDFAYMAKGWTGAVTDVRTVFRIEASIDGHDSIFTSHYSFESGQNPPSSTTKGDGISTAAFQTFIAAKFIETGNKWNIGLTYRNGLAGPIGASVLAYSPNDPHTFSFRLNTTGNGYAQIIDEETDTPIITQVLSTSGLAGVAALSGGDPISSMWFVTGGSGTILNSFTFLDDPSDDTLDLPSDSSCIFFEPPAVLFGSPGVTPPSQAPSPDDIDGDGIPNDKDVDIDGDGLCNDDSNATMYPAGTPGAEDGCVGGDTDDDGDRILDIFDTTPNGPGSGTDAAPTISGAVNTGSALGQLIGAGAVVLGAIVVGFGLTANKRRRREE